MAHPSQRLTSGSLIITAALLLALTTPTHALSVAKKAAVGISVGFGTLLIISLVAILYLKFSPQRRAERAARQRGEVTDADAIEFHAREQTRNFNIWDYDHKAVMAKKKAAKERQEEARAAQAAALEQARANGNGNANANGGVHADQPVKADGHGRVEEVA